jgi:hypothetical protein
MEIHAMASEGKAGFIAPGLHPSGKTRINHTSGEVSAKLTQSLSCVLS